MTRTVTDIYRFTLSETRDLIDASDGNISLAFDYAINSARDRARLYVTPCQWTATYDKRHGFIVRRTREASRNPRCTIPVIPPMKG